MSANIKDNLKLYPALTNPIRWVLIWYRFGKWVETIRFKSLRIVCDKIYWIFQSLLSTFTTVHFDRRLTFGKNFYVIHPISIVIHPDVIIGDNVGIMHEVTIGTRGSTGAPRIGNRVFIGAGAKIIGEITIGDNVDIGANSVVLTDVPANSLVVGNPGRIIKKNAKKPKPWD